MAEAAFVPNTPISSSAVNSDLSDIATGLSTAVTKDGQTVITAPFKGFSGSVGAPMYSFSADTDSGLYRIAANNLGISVNATKILDIATTGLSVVGTVAPSTTVTNANGTEALPSYTFASDLDTGMWRIGANNIGIGVNAAKVLDISAAGLNVIGGISSNGAALSPLAAGGGMVNGTIAESHAGNAATFAIKTLAGTDPSASDPVFCVFRNVTPGTGNYVVIQLTAALSLTISSGSTLGFTSATAGRVWLVLFNDGGTVRLGAINCRSGSSVFGLSGFGIASSTAEGGAGGADSAQVFYTGTAVASKAFSVIAYAGYESGLATAGSWDASPTRLVLFDAGVPLPGQPVQTFRTDVTSTNNTNVAIPLDDTIPQQGSPGEGKEFMSQAVTGTSFANLWRVRSNALLSDDSSSTTMISAMFRDAEANAIGVNTGAAAAGTVQAVAIDKTVLIGAVASLSQTFKVRGGSPTGNTIRFNGISTGQIFNGTADSYIEVIEIMA